MIETGIDWSGDPGYPNMNPADPGFLVIAACSLSSESRPSFEHAIHHLKQELRLPDHHVFKHLKSVQSTRDRYLQMLERSGVRTTVLCIDKRKWSESSYQQTKGPERIVKALVELAIAMDDSDVAGQRLLIDAKRAERGFLSELRRALRSGLGSQGRSSFKKVSPRPDDRSDAVLIQAADMVSGHVRRHVEKAKLNAVIDKTRWKVVIQ